MGQETQILVLSLGDPSLGAPTEAQLRAFFPIPPSFLEFELNNQHNLGTSYNLA